jgi:SAM-dependent methyltransferase
MPSTQATQRERAAWYFASTVPRWEEFYAAEGEETVYRTIYRQRLAVALSLAYGLRLPPQARCLDVGCGPGLATVDLARRGLLVDAVDLVPAQLQTVRRRAASAGVEARVITRTGDIHALDFADATFDLVFVVGVLEWLEQPTQALREIARVLKPGGRAILSIDNKWALRNLFDPLFFPPFAPLRRGAAKLLRRVGMRRPPGPRDYAYSLREFDALAARAGLSKTGGLTVGFGPFSFCRYELPQGLGLALHRRLQRFAAAGFSALRSAGLVYLTIVAKNPADG